MNRAVALFATVVALGFIVLAFQRLGPWTVAALPSAGGIALLVMGRDREGAGGRQPRGLPLRSARIEVNRLEPCDVSIPPSWDPEAQEDPESDRRFFWLDVTVLPLDVDPAAPRGWRPADLALVHPTFDPRRHEIGDDDSCEVRQVRIEESGIVRAAEERMVAGAQRLLLGIGVREAVPVLKFVCHEESFGRVEIPAGPDAPTRARDAAGRVRPRTRALELHP